MLPFSPSDPSPLMLTALYMAGILGGYALLTAPEEWQRAWRVAEAVYYGKEIPKLQGALHFHATYLQPDWAKSKQRVARIGRHVFYK